MPEFTCPLCRKAFAVPAESAAARVRCPHCRQAVDLPRPPVRWFFARDNKKHGPFTWQELHTLVEAGTLCRDDMLLQEGEKKWVCAETLAQLFPARREPRPSGPDASPSQAGAKPPAESRGRFALLVSLAGLGLVVIVSLCALAGYAIFGRGKSIEQPLADGGQIVEIKTTPAEKSPPPTGVARPRLDKTIIKKDDPGPPKDKPTPRDPREQWVDPFITRLNRYRQAAGLGSVRLDESLSPGCLAHAKYVAEHVDPLSADSAEMHDENAGKSGYSAEGERAGKTALIAFAAPPAALELWMARVVSRLPLLNTELRTVGLGFAENAKGDWVCVLDSVRGRGEPIVVYPAPRQTEVPLSFSGGPEVPEEKAVGGFPITVSFPPGVQIASPTIELRDDAGRDVNSWIWTPAKPVPKSNMRNTLALIPRGMLLSSHVYQAKVSAQVDGKPWRLAWSFTTEDDSDSKGVWAKKALARVNLYRSRAGLPAVALDEALSHGCGLHARYVVLNADHPAVQGLSAHDEDLSLPGASEEGRKAGKASNIAMGDFEPLDGIDAWMATLYHRIPILEPNLKRIGFGCARSPRFGWITVLNVGSGREAGERPHPVLYPAPNQTGVPLNFPIGGEEPNPIPESTTGRAGYPITMFFPRKNPLLNATGKLTTVRGDEVACWMSSPEKPANPRFATYQDTTVCLIPKEPLEPEATYYVHVQGRLGGAAWNQRWKFTTAEAGVSSVQGARQALDRLNQARMRAGLSGVTLDEKQSLGCQRHAEYLVKNAEILLKRKASVNEEDPLLPGYTAEGQRAARQSDVFTNAPVPVTQIDDLMATATRRALLLDPTLQRIGFGCAHDVGRGWRCVLDLNGGKGDPRIVLYPAPKQSDVPCVGADRIDGAKNNTLGFPITVIFPPHVSPRNPQAVLTDAAGNVEIRLSSGLPINVKSQPNVITVQPLAPLRPNQTYSITVSAIANAVEFRHTWQFTTGKR